MIFDSFYWKRDLAKRAAWLENKLKQERWSEQSYARLEQEVMLGFYCIRKLAEAKKLSDEVVNMQITLMSFKFHGHIVTHQNWTNVDKHYQLQNGRKLTKTVKYVANQIVHSFVFLPVHLEGTSTLEGIAFNSDKTKSEVLFTMRLSDIAALFYRASMEYGRRTRKTDPRTGMTVYVVDD